MYSRDNVMRIVGLQGRINRVVDKESNASLSL